MDTKRLFYVFEIYCIRSDLYRRLCVTNSVGSDNVKVVPTEEILVGQLEEKTQNATSSFKDYYDEYQTITFYVKGYLKKTFPCKMNLGKTTSGNPGTVSLR